MASRGPRRHDFPARLEEEDRAKKELADLYEMGVDHPDFDRRLDAFAPRT